jgi:long-chain fatty acid transport protein
MKRSLALTTSALFAVGTLGAQAGGFELSPLSTSFMYEDGGYAEIGYSSRNYSVTGSVYAPTSSVVQDQTNTALAFKFDLSDGLSLGLSQYRQGSIQLDYSGAGSPLAAALPVVDLDIDAVALLARYQVNENFSVLGGLKRTTVKDAVANIFQSAPLPQSNITGTSEIGYVYGVAYQRDDIALRVELTAETSTDFELATTNEFAGGGVTTASVPDYLNLAFQSGIAKDTLVFGSIRKANWASNQIQVHPDPDPTSSFSDSTTYNIGLGRKINEDFSVFASYSTEAAGDENKTSLLNVTNGYKGISIGVAYSLDNATITFGGNYTKLGDVNMDAADDGTFESSFAGNTVKSLGLKLAYNF